MPAYTNCQYRVGVCSPDNIQYQFSFYPKPNDDPTQVYRRTVTRVDNTLPEVALRPGGLSVDFECESDTAGCDIRVRGTVLSENTILIRVRGSSEGTTYCGENGFEDFVEVELDGACALLPDSAEM